MKAETTILPKGLRILATLGENIKLARLRRKLTVNQIADRAGISRQRLSSIENGEPQVAMGAYFQVLFVLGLEKDFLHLAKDELLDCKLKDIGIPIKKRAPKKRSNQVANSS